MQELSYEFCRGRQEENIIYTEALSPHMFMHFWDCPIEFAHLSAEVRYSPFEFLPQDNTGKVADESQAEEAVKAHGVQSENSKSGGTHHPWKLLGFLSVELNVI